MTQKILKGEVTDFEDLGTVEELWRLSGIAMFAKLAYKVEGFVDVLNGTFIDEITDLLRSATAWRVKESLFSEWTTEWKN